MKLELPLLSAVPGLRHAFFTREGGVSGGIYGSLNGGIGSNDDPALVEENRRRMAEAAGRRARALSQRLADPLARCRGDHGTVARRDAAACRRHRHPHRRSRHRRHRRRLRADLVRRPGARVIGAAHAGWKGALTGILESTIETMEKLGAERSGIVAAIGPLIRQRSYEVGGEFVERFIEADAENGLFFLPSAREGHSMFDLAGFIRMRLENAGVLVIDDTGIDTYSDERFFSYRRSVHRKEPDYGRHVHAIALERA